MTIHDAPPADAAGDGTPDVGAASSAGALTSASAAGGSELFDLDDGIDDVAPRPRRRRSKLTAALAAVALVGAGAIAGVAADQHWGPDASATTPRVAGFGGSGARGTGGQSASGGQTAAGTGQAGGGQAGTGAQGSGAQGAEGGQAAQGGQGGQGTGRGNGGGFGGGGGRAGAAAVGRVARVEGSTLVVTANDGSEVRVDSKGAIITQPAPVAVSALTAGELVIVQGTTNADGTVTATQVTANNAPAGGGGGGGAGGGGGSAPAAGPPTTATG